MSLPCRFVYSPSVSSFLSDLTDLDSRYAEATRQLEYFLQRDIKIGDPIDRSPLVFRRFVIRLVDLEALAFYYIYNVKDGVYDVGIVRVELASDTPSN